MARKSQAIIKRKAPRTRTLLNGGYRLLTEREVQAERARLNFQDDPEEPMPEPHPGEWHGKTPVYAHQAARFHPNYKRGTP